MIFVASEKTVVVGVPAKDHGTFSKKFRYFEQTYNYRHTPCSLPLLATSDVYIIAKLQQTRCIVGCAGGAGS